MDFIFSIFELDLSGLVPEMSKLLSQARFWVTLAILAGPILMFLLGLFYLLIPPKEANHKAGFRTYFGMGSVRAWKFTQRAAGIAYSAVGLALGIWMLVVVLGFDKMDHFQMVNTAISCLLWQAGLALLARLTVVVLVMILFNRNGERRGETYKQEKRSA